MKRYLALLLPLLCSGQALADDHYEITIFGINGEKKAHFQVTDDDIIADHVELGPNGLLYISQSFSLHTPGDIQFEDAIVAYTQDGQWVETIRDDAMQSPGGFHIYPDGSLLIAGQSVNLDPRIYAFNHEGMLTQSFTVSLGASADRYNDLIATPDGQSFVSFWGGSGTSMQMAEITQGGESLNVFSPTGPSYFHEDLAYDNDGTLWVRSPHNGSGGDDLIKHFALDGAFLGEFSTSGFSNSFRGLEVNNQGQILAFENALGAIYTMSPLGDLVGLTYLDGVSDQVVDFTVTPAGHVVILHRADDGVGCNQSSGDARDILPASLLLLGGLFWRRRQHTRQI